MEGKAGSKTMQVSPAGCSQACCASLQGHNPARRASARSLPIKVSLASAGKRC